MATNISSLGNNKGRRKVQMVRMEKDSNRRVTFSKRRSGLFKKASELCILCGVEAAIIVFSPGKKAFSFGDPSVEKIIKCFMLSENLSSNSKKEHSTKTESSASVVDLNMKLSLLSNALEMEMKKSEEINKIKKSSEQQHYRREFNYEEFTLDQLIYLESSLQALSQNVTYHGNMLMMLEALKASQIPFKGDNYRMIRCETNGGVSLNPNGVIGN